MHWFHKHITFPLCMNQTPSISLPPGLHKDFLQLLVELEGMLPSLYFPPLFWGGGGAFPKLEHM